MVTAYWILISAFILLFFPRQLTHLICFGRNRDQQFVRTQGAYWGIYAFWTIIFLIPCLMMGSVAGIHTVMDNVMAFYVLRSDDRLCIDLGSETSDEAYICSYYTRKEINEDFLVSVVQKTQFDYEDCQLQDLKVTKVSERKWLLYLDYEVMGYVEVKKRFLIKEFCYVWDRQKMDQRRVLYEKKNE